MRRDLRDYVDDMIAACEDIVDTVGTMEASQLAGDRLRLKAIIRDLEVLGEASRKLPLGLRERFPNVPWRQLAAMRNKLIHEYFGVDSEIVHATATISVPRLLDELRSLRKTLDEDGWPEK